MSVLRTTFVGLIFVVLLVGCGSNDPPQASFTAVPIEDSTEVEFDASGSTDPEDNIASYAWNFGDGQTGSGATVTHVYELGGSYEAKLTVTDEGEETDTTTQFVSVSEPMFPPLFAEIEPADGAVLRGTEAWVRWYGGEDASGRVLWRKAGDTRLHRVEAMGTDPLAAQLAPLQLGQQYEYVVEQISAGFVQRSSLRSFTVEGGVVFDPPVVDQTIQRDYNQIVTLTLRNSTDEAIEVAARALLQFDDLPAEIVGPGSVDDPSVLEPGQSLDLSLAVFAPDATQRDYEILIEAAGAVGRARVYVEQPDLELDFQVTGEDPNTLAKTVKITNLGDKLTDLSVRIASPQWNDVRLNPSASHARLDNGESMTFVASPVLYLEFESLEAELECKAAGQSVHFPLQFVAPSDKRLIGVRTASQETSRLPQKQNAGDEGAELTTADNSTCPNKPISCTDQEGGNATGAAPPPIRAPARTPTPEGGAEGGVSRSFGGALAWRPAGLEDVPPLVGWPPISGDCDSSQLCSPLKRLACYAEAWALMKQYRLALERLGEVIPTIPIDGTSGEVRPDLPAGQDDRAKEVGALLDKIEELERRYDVVRRRCWTKCGLVMPQIGEKTPRELDREFWKKTLDALGDLFLAIADKLRHPRNTPELRALIVKFCEYWDLYLESAGDPELGMTGQGAEVLSGFEVPGVKETLDAICADPFLFAEILASGDVARSGIVNQIQDLGRFLKNVAENDPPSPLFRQVLRPTAESSEVAQDARIPGPLHDALNAQTWVNAYLKAYATSFERYQGAQEVGDFEGMVVQSEAMADFADRALHARQIVTARLYEYELGLYSRLTPLLQAVEALGGPQRMFADYRQRFGTDGLTLKRRERLVASGKSEIAVETIDRQLRTVSGAAVESRLSQWTQMLSEAERVRSQPSSDRAWLEPSEAAMLTRLHSAAEEMAADAEITAETKLRSRISSRPLLALRPGLLECLQRRATFSRAHRGAYAAPIHRSTDLSSENPSAWHNDDRVCFAWHHEDSAIVVVMFDGRGEEMFPPQVLGEGRWPRVTADGRRTAVAWQSDDRFIVRVHDGGQWGREIELAGLEAAIAFAPDGALFAVTTEGLWKLTDEKFELVRDAQYSQPALAIDTDGQPRVAWHKDGRILFEGAEVAEGERPTIIITPDEIVHLAYLSGGGLFVRSLTGREWSGPETIPAFDPKWPALALDDQGNVRLTYIGDADPGPDALWLVRLPDVESVLMPSVAGNVTDAWFLLKLTLAKHLSEYRPYDLLLTVNDVWIKSFEQSIPQGRFLFRLNPYQVFTSTGRPVVNRIGLYSWYMNSGHYWTASDYEMRVRTAWSEHHAYASGPEEVKEAIDRTGRFNHDQPDLAILANNLDLPKNAPEDGNIDFPVMIANLGEGVSKPARLVMHVAEDDLATADVPALYPDDQFVVTMRLDGYLTAVDFRLEQEDEDFRPDNDSLHLQLWSERSIARAMAAGQEEPARTTPDEPPARLAKPEVQVVHSPIDVEPAWIAGSLPIGATGIGEWSWLSYERFRDRATHSSEAEETQALHYFIGTDDPLPLAEGDNLVQYVYLDPDDPPREIMLQLYTEGGKVAQQIYWGEDLIDLGPAPSYRAGELPEAGTWIRLRIPLESLDIGGLWLTGMLYGQYDGRVIWGPTTKSLSRLDLTDEVLPVDENGQLISVAVERATRPQGYLR